jgi:hypothetical protein
MHNFIFSPLCSVFATTIIWCFCAYDFLMFLSQLLNVCIAHHSPPLWVTAAQDCHFGEIEVRTLTTGLLAASHLVGSRVTVQWVPSDWCLRFSQIYADLLCSYAHMLLWSGVAPVVSNGSNMTPTLYSKLLIHVWISQLAHALLPRTYHLMPRMGYMLLECPIRASHPQMGRSDWTLLKTSVSPLVSSDMYVATGQVQEYSALGNSDYMLYLNAYIYNTYTVYCILHSPAALVRCGAGV